MKSKIALVDWDNTLRRGFTLLDWVDWLTDRGQFPGHVTRELHDLMGAYWSGVLPYGEFATSMTDGYARGLAGQRVDAIEESAIHFAHLDNHRLYSFAPRLFKILQSCQIDVVVVSGCPIEPLKAYQAYLNMSEIYGLAMQVTAGRYLPNPELNPAGYDGKKMIVGKLDSESLSIALAIGDSTADIPLLDAAEYRIVVDNPTLLPAGPTVLHISSEPGEADFERMVRFIGRAQLGDHRDGPGDYG